jgi:hypothetical protein
LVTDIPAAPIYGNREARCTFVHGFKGKTARDGFYSSIPKGIELIIKYFELKGMPVLCENAKCA